MKKIYSWVLFLCWVNTQLLCNDYTFAIKGLEHAEKTTTAFLFAHGLASTWEQGINILWRHGSPARPHWVMDGPLAVFDFPDAKKERQYYHKEVNLAQEKDLERLHHAYSKTIEALPSHNFILVGISRGAAAMLNYAALYQPKEVKALLVESPFDTLSSVVKHLLTRYHVGWVPFSKTIGFKVCQSHFPSINIKGIFPLNVVEKIPAEMPIMLVHSKKDRTVPINSSRRLYIKLKETGHEHVYLVELQSGNHGKLIFGPDADFYNYCAHAFYQKYDLAHNPEFARHGQNLLQLCQPSVQDVLTRIKHKRGFNEDEIDEYELTLVDDDEEEELVAIKPA